MWARHQALASEAVERLEQRIASNGRRGEAALREVLERVIAEQDESRPAAWGDVRLIVNQDLLVVEYAIEGVLDPEAGPRWAYQAARFYTEEYDPSYGNGLIPASARRVEEIADFWCRHHFAQPLADWMASATSTLVERSPKPASYPPRKRPAKPPRPSKSVIASTWPAVAAWVARGGQVEIGQAGGHGSFIQAMDEGGIVWEGRHEYPSLDAALSALDRALAKRRT